MISLEISAKNRTCFVRYIVFNTIIRYAKPIQKAQIEW